MRCAPTAQRLLLDEPSEGLAPIIVEQILELLLKLKATGLTMVLVEQKLDIALPFASRAFVVIKGRVAMAEPCSSLAARSDLGQLYFNLAAAQH